MGGTFIMTTRNRPIVRTPRRSKIWCQYTSFVDITAGTPGLVDLLAPTMTNLGLSVASGLTHLRTVGHVALVAGTTPVTSSAVFDRVRLGLLWQTSNVSSSSVGDTNIPEPREHGLWDTRWIHQMSLAAFEQNTVDYVFSPLEPIERSLLQIDVTQMRKQPATGARFCLAWDGGSAFTADAVNLEVTLSTLIALP